jgi:hypothetical protein
MGILTGALAERIPKLFRPSGKESPVFQGVVA